MIIARTLCTGCGREIEERSAHIKDGVPYCCESCAETGRCERGCGTDIQADEPVPSDPIL
jgi:hypothetical protein